MTVGDFFDYIDSLNRQEGNMPPPCKVLHMLGFDVFGGRIRQECHEEDFEFDEMDEEFIPCNDDDEDERDPFYDIYSEEVYDFDEEDERYSLFFAILRLNNDRRIYYA